MHAARNSRACSLLLALACVCPPQAADKNGVSPSAISLPSGPGSMEGLGESFQPTLNTGTAGYGVALSVPPGTAGHQPSLKLRYEGGGGNGMLGFGWSIPLPFVQRRTDKGVPLYGNDPGLNRPDRFINESKEELILQADGFSFCENEGAFVRYRQLDEHWEGTLPNGTKLEFGISANSRVSNGPGGPVFCWLLERETDTRGNTIVYQYRSFPGDDNANQKYLSSVTYGAGGAPWENFHFAEFEYEQRSDWYEDCRAGFPIRSGMRLKTVTIGTQGPVLDGHAAGDWNADGTADYLNRKYELAYLNYAADATHWSLLETVQVVGADGESRLPPTTFGYAICNPPDALSADGQALAGVNEPLAAMDNELVELADLNADGLPDVLRTFGGALPHQAFLNQGVDAGTQQIRWRSGQEIAGDERAWGIDLGSALNVAHLADMNGDGLADLAFKAPSGDVFFFANGGALTWGARQLMAPDDTAPPSPFGSPSVRAADMDFDKRMDIIQSIDAGGAVAYRIWFNLGAERYSAPITVEPEGAFPLNDPAVQLADFNGDRLPDLIRIQPEQLRVKAGLGYGRFSPTAIVPLPDFALSAEQLARAKLTDITGDGLVDLVLERAAPSQLWYWINHGNYQFSGRKTIGQMPATAGQQAVVRWADMNGNGTTDLVYADSTSEPRLQTVDVGDIINCGLIPNVLTSIANGLGRTISITHKTSIDFRLADEAAGRPWPHAMPFPVPVVSSVRISDSFGHEYLTEYRYHDGYYDPEQKQFRGFERVEQIHAGDDTAPTLINQSFFDAGITSVAMKGKLRRQTAELEDGRLFWEANTTWTEPPRVLKTGVNGVEIKFVHPLGSTVLTKELGQGTERVIETASEFDELGNQTLAAEYGIVENGDRSAFDDERITTTQYAIDLDRWLIRFPSRTEVADENGVIISRTENFYDDETFAGDDSSEVTIGNLTLTREWVDPANLDAFIETSRTKYDSFGNAVRILDPLAKAPGGEIDDAAGHYRTVRYDERFHNNAVEEIVQLGDGKAPLVFTAAYDDGFGTLVSSTDFNSHVTSYQYDALARLITIIKPGDSLEYPTSEYGYNLAVATPEGGLVNIIETRLLDQKPGTHPAKADHYLISREFMDGLGRPLFSKKEAGPLADGQQGVVVNSAVTFNARASVSLALNPFYSRAGDSLESLMAYENIEAPDWKGRFHLDGDLVDLDLAAAHKISTVYDATLREVKSFNPDGTFETTRYEPFLTRMADANRSDPGSPFFGTSMVHATDGLKRLIRVDEVVRLNDDGTPSAELKTWSTHYDHDLNDQLFRITDSQGNVKLMAYDGLARKIFMNDPDRGESTQEFDAASNLIRTTDAKGQAVTFTYDGANRMLSEDFHDDELPAYDPASPLTPSNRPDVAYFYDTPFSDAVDVGDGTTLAPQNTRGALTAVWDLTGEEHFTYDAREHASAVIKRVIDPLGAGLISFRTGYTFDSLNRVTSVRYPDNDVVQYEYNERGLGRRISGGPTGSIISRMLYTPAGHLSLISYGNGVETTNTYDLRLRLRNSRAIRTSDGVEHIAVAYNFDAASNVRVLSDIRSSGQVSAGAPRRNTQFAEYDDLYRLNRVQYSFQVPGEADRDDGEIRYRYDRIGNMLSQMSTINHVENGISAVQLGEMQYGGSGGRMDRVGRRADDPPGPHALSSVSEPSASLGPRAYSYDANGNMLTVDGVQTTWDFKDRLVAVETDKGSGDYRYDYRDRRITRKVLSNASARVDSTISVDQYFEIRQNSLPVKYVWNGTARVARITGMLSSTERVQRIRLWPGWNLCSLAVTAERAGEKLAANPAVSAILRWNPVEQKFEILPPGDTVPSGSILWIDCNTATQAIISGIVSDTVPSAVPANGFFQPSDPLQPIDLDQLAPLTTSIWYWNAPAQLWEVRLADALPSESLLPDSMVPGEGVFIRADAAVNLSLPPAALNVRYYHQDHLGSSAIIADADGNVLEENTFYPFGVPRHTEKSVKTSDPYQFTQKERDAESGLNYMEARFQSPLLGRFIRVDPLAAAMKSSWLEEPQRLNLYAYCANAPLANTDPSGTDLVAMFKGFAGGIGETVLEVANPLNAHLTLVHATVGVANIIEHNVVKGGGILVETYNGNYKEAAKLAFVDDRVVKILDPKTTDKETGKMIGQATGQALIIVATHKAGAPKGPAAPGPAAPPAAPKVSVGPPMSPAQQVAKTQPAMGTKTLRDPTLATEVSSDYGIRVYAERRFGKAARLEWEASNGAKMSAWGQEFSRRIQEARPAMDKMIEETGSAKPIIRQIGKEVNEQFPGWD